MGARITFQAHGEIHTQYIDSSGGTPVPMVASRPSRVKAKIKDWKPRIHELEDDEQHRAGRLIGKAIAIEARVAILAWQVRARRGNVSVPESALHSKQQELADILSELFELLELPV